MHLLCGKRNIRGISKTKQFYEEGMLAWEYINNSNLPWLETLSYLVMEEEINQIAIQRTQGTEDEGNRSAESSATTL